MGRQIRIEISSRDKFWRKAVMIEWEHQFPDRKLSHEPSGAYLIEAAWLDDLTGVAKQCFSEIAIAPEDPSRRLWFRRIIPRRDSGDEE